MLRFLFGLFLLAVGLLLTTGDLFLAYWSARAEGHADVAARGPFLLSLILPYIVFGVAVVTLAVALWRGPRGFYGSRASVGGALLMTTVAWLLLYGDPNGYVWRALQPARSVLGAPSALATDLVIIAMAALCLGWLRHASGREALSGRGHR